MKEKTQQKEQHKLYTIYIQYIYIYIYIYTILFTKYTGNILGKKINSSTIVYLFIYSASNITYLSGHGQRLIH